MQTQDPVIQEELPKQDPPRLTGPNAIEHALGKLDLKKLETEQRDIIDRKLVSKRPKAVQILNVLEGLKRNNVKPTDFLIRNVPVIPTDFRPFTAMGGTFVAGDANELYRDLIDMRDAHRQERKVFGDDGAGESRVGLYNAVKATYGYGDPVKPKTKQRGVSGFLKKVTGSNPKHGFFQQKLIGKTQDNVARGTIGVNPDLSMDQIDLPKDMAWRMYAPYIQRRLVQAGVGFTESIKHIRDRSKLAEQALVRETQERPVIYSRSPSWHKYNVLAGKPNLIDGDAIRINPFVTTGLNADFDGDAINLHVPSSKEVVREALEKLSPSKQLLSTRDPSRVVPSLKHEQILGLYTAKHRAGNKFTFASKEEALAAIRRGEVSLNDDITIRGGSIV